MTLTLVRERPVRDHMFGVLFVDGAFQCHTLEDVPRAAKVPGATAIPAGDYGVVITHSPKFARRLPLVEQVPGFEGIRIHSGNYARDTEGCVLVGQGRDGDGLTRSVLAFDDLFRRMVSAQSRGEAMRLRVVAADQTFGAK